METNLLLEGLLLTKPIRNEIGGRLVLGGKIRIFNPPGCRMVDVPLPKEHSCKPRLMPETFKKSFVGILLILEIHIGIVRQVFAEPLLPAALVDAAVAKLSEKNRLFVVFIDLTDLANRIDPGQFQFLHRGRLRG